MRALLPVVPVVLAVCLLHGCAPYYDDELVTYPYSEPSTYSEDQPLAHPNDQLLASFDGRHVSQAIATLGPPTQVLDNGQGGQVISWTQETVYVPPQPLPPQPLQPCPPGLDPLGYAFGQGIARGLMRGMTSPAYVQGPQRIVSWQIVFVDPNGIVRYWSWRQGGMHGSKAEYNANQNH